MSGKDNGIVSQAIRKAYRKGQEDETLVPHVLVSHSGRPVGRLRSGDGVIFYNLRGEREIELTRSLTEPGFDKFPVEADLSLAFATMIEYHKDLGVNVAFPPTGIIGDTLSEVIAGHDMKQIKITESEKAFHVGYFFNGKRDTPFPEEERIVIPTRKDVTLFDEAPEMSLDEITKAIRKIILSDKHQFILANFPNVDVVGHVENEKAVIRAVEAVDSAAGVIIEAARKEGITVLVTADHGSVEKWYYPGGVVDTGHTDSPVPCILLHPQGLTLREAGELADVAPTILHLLGLPKPPAMTGTSLIVANQVEPVRRVLLLILDGWGFRETSEGNLIFRAHTPTMDRLWRLRQKAILEAAGEYVGLPLGTVGNSEAGHIHLGAGRRIYSDRVRIDRARADGSFFHNRAFLEVMRQVKRKGTALHLLGIVSHFSSHGSIEHLFDLMEMARQEGIAEVFIHAMLGRRGELPESGANYMEKVEKKAIELGVGEVVSVIGRYWALDREENWDRVEKTYRMLVWGEGLSMEKQVTA